ncbi:MAG: hypothetical protein K9L17_05800 [Clostridiales bacterium]|nr:hypothetical protein [Clostridiales bacterium]MCF8022185.1 hypothetical protein [Clostridiales bacterium]
MTFPNFNSPDEEIKKWLHQIAFICLSEEFKSLKLELEKIYLEYGEKNYRLAAFQDALYAFLTEKENEEIKQSEAY